jgi:hypothetical protein
MSEKTRQQVRTQGYVLVASDIPGEMTIAEYRAARPAPAPRRRRRWFRLWLR